MGFPLIADAFAYTPDVFNALFSSAKMQKVTLTALGQIQLSSIGSYGQNLFLR